MTRRIAPWGDKLPDDMTCEQGMQVAMDRMSWRAQGYPDPGSFEGWEDPQSLDYLLNRPTMDTLNLSSLKLERFPEGLERQVDVDYLFMMSNCISQVPEAFLAEGSVMSLHLFDNRIVEVPPKLFALDRLEELYLGRNPIRRLALPEKQNLVLRFLMLDQCPGISIPDTFFHLFPHLKSLALNGSDLDQIPTSVFALAELKQLELEDNPLTRVAPEIGGLTNLTQLDISRCQLETLPKELSLATGLREVMKRTTLDSFGLRIAGNPFRDKELRRIAKLKNPARTLEALDWAAANGE